MNPVNPAELRAAAARMRDDWDRRAREDAERFIYTRDNPADVEIGRASCRERVCLYV